MAALKQPVTNQSGTTSPRDHLAGLPSREEIAAYHLIDETRLVGGLVERAVYTEDERRRSAEMRPSPRPGRAGQSKPSTAASMPSCTSTGCPRTRASS